MLALVPDLVHTSIFEMDQSLCKALVTGGNTTRYQCLAFGTGWVSVINLWVTSKEKYLSSYDKYCVCERVKEVYGERQ